MNKTVRAFAGNIDIQSTHRCCAERALLDTWVTLAGKNGVPQHSIVRWVRRKTRGFMVIERFVCNGSKEGCCVPCVLCRRALEKFDISVQCFLDDQGKVFVGKLHADQNAPKSQFTSKQRRVFSNCSDGTACSLPRHADP